MKRNRSKPEQKFSPAPVIPEIMPHEGRDMNGMIPDVAPQAARANE